MVHDTARLPQRKLYPRGQLLIDGGVRKLDGKGLFIEPTVFADATNDPQISREEIFGPVLKHWVRTAGKGNRL